MVNLIADILLVSAIVPLVVSVVIYSRVTWFKTPLGRFFMSYHFSMLSLWVIILLLRHPFGLDRQILGHVSLGIFAVISLILWWGMFLMRRYVVKDGERVKDSRRRV